MAASNFPAPAGGTPNAYFCSARTPANGLYGFCLIQDEDEQRPDEVAYGSPAEPVPVCRADQVLLELRFRARHYGNVPTR